MAIKTTFRSEKEFRSITKLIAEELRGAIIAGKIAPGEQLIEDQLAGSLKVGHVPLRDALRRLEAEGYVTAIAHDRFVVSKPTVEEIEDYYSIAGALEGLAEAYASAATYLATMTQVQKLCHQLNWQHPQVSGLTSQLRINFIQAITRTTIPQTT
jgi:DNA-binding GntR family transcriptional regulator